MSDDQKNNLPIKYTSREFSSIREDLLELVERFYPENFQDFSEASFGAMMLDATAYVADQVDGGAAAGWWRVFFVNKK